MNLNFDEFRGYCFSVDGKALSSYEDCKEWLALKFHYRGWAALVRQTGEEQMIRMFENQALDLYTYLLEKGQIK